MTDEQFDKLMKKLEDIERQLEAGTWMPQRTYQLPPDYLREMQRLLVTPSHLNQATD